MSREPAVPGGAEHFLIALAHAHARGRARSRVREDRTACATAISAGQGAQLTDDGPKRRT
jgi:hypothetical protein